MNECVTESSWKLLCVTNAHVLCPPSLRQRGYWGRQCRGEGECELPAHHRQSANSFWTVTQTGATCLTAHRHKHGHTDLAQTHTQWTLEWTCKLHVTRRTIYTAEIPHTHTHTQTATKSHYKQWRQVDSEMSCVFDQTHEDTELHAACSLKALWHWNMCSQRISKLHSYSVNCPQEEILHSKTWDLPNWNGE